MQFDLNNTQRWVSFCSASTFGVSSFTLNLNVGGDNAASFVFSNKVVTINIVSSPALMVVPTFSLSASNVQKTFATIQVATNIPGYLFYQLAISPLALPLSLADIHTYIKSNTPILESNSDYLTTKIYKTDRDQRVGFADMLVGGINFINIDSLLPERKYTFCAYF